MILPTNRQPTIETRTFGGITIAKYDTSSEFLIDVNPNNLPTVQTDLFSFWNRDWIQPRTYSYPSVEDNICLLQVTSHAEWFHNLHRKTRNMIRKNLKTQCTVRPLRFCEDTYKRILNIFHETATRQGRTFPNYYMHSFHEVEDKMAPWKDTSCLIGLFLHNELIGFTDLVFVDGYILISHFLSYTRHYDKAPNNRLMSEIVKTAEAEGISNIVYGKMASGNTGLNRFRLHHGFRRYPVPRYYVAISGKGRVIMKIGINRSYRWMKKLLNVRHAIFAD